VIAFLLCVFATVFPLISARHVARWSLADGADADGPDGMTQLLQSWAFLPAAVAFFSVLAHTGMWNTARILEDPFVHPPNDLPSVAMQRAFNARLMGVWDALRDPALDDVGGPAGGGGGGGGGGGSDAADEQAWRTWRQWDTRCLAKLVALGEEVETASRSSASGRESAQSSGRDSARDSVQSF